MAAWDANRSMSAHALNSPEVRRGIKEFLLNHSDLYAALRAQYAQGTAAR